MNTISVEFPLKLKGSNAREHHMARSRRVDRERSATRRALAEEAQPGPLLVVRLTRIAPGTLDPGDNLPVSLKGVRDQVSTWLAVDDRSQLVRWEYAQEKVKQPRKAKPVDRVRVEVFAAGEAPAAAPAFVYGSTAEQPLHRMRPVKRLCSRELADLATPATHHPKKPATCADCLNRVHEQRWDGRCGCACHAEARR